jgi:hypothetical protein
MRLLMEKSLLINEVLLNNLIKVSSLYTKAAYHVILPS